MGTIDIKLPDIGEGVTEGELVNWLVKVGDQVTPDQPLAEVMTDKATVEIPSPDAGVVTELKANPGDVLTIGAPMMSIQKSGTVASPSPAVVTPSTVGTQAVVAPAVAAVSAAPPVAVTGGGGAVEMLNPPVADSKVLATPATRRLAREMKVDINVLTGTGLAGRVTREDVVKVASSMGAGATAAGQPIYQPSIPVMAYQGPVGALEERVALKGVRKKIAENMQMVKQIVPHFTLMDDADVTELVAMREKIKDTAKELGIKVTYLPFVMKALIATIREFPMFNASIDDQAKEIVYKKYFNIGFAADTPQGLLVPVIKDADKKSIIQLSKEIVDLSTRARDGKLKPEEMKGATITITNIGSVGGTYATPIINHPEVAILGMYKITDKPVIVNGELQVVKSMNFTITADHRLIDGAVAARFLQAFFKRIEHPGHLMLEMM